MSDEVEPFEYGIELLRHSANAAAWADDQVADFLYQIRELGRLCDQSETNVAQSLIDEGRVGEFVLPEGGVLVVRDRKQVGKNRYDHKAIRERILGWFCESDDERPLFEEFVDVWTKAYTTPPSRVPSRSGLAGMGILAEEYNRGGEWVDDAYVRVLTTDEVSRRAQGNQQRNNRIAAARAVENEVGF